jgi:hypothetical protein
VLLLQRHSVLPGGVPAFGLVQQPVESTVLERLHRQPRSYYLLRLDQRQQPPLHMPRKHRKLLTGAAVPTVSLGLGTGFALALGRPVGVAALLALFLFSCVLVGLAQQTLP